MKSFNACLLLLIMSTCLSHSAITHAIVKSSIDMFERDFNDAAVMRQFQADITSAMHKTLADKTYRRIPLDNSARQQWFVDVIMGYWHGNTDLETLVFLGERKFPTYGESFRQFAKNLRRMSSNSPVTLENKE